MFYRFFFLVFAWFACATVFVWPTKNKNSRRQLHAAMMISKIDNAMNLKLPSTVRRNGSLGALYDVGYVIWVAVIHDGCWIIDGFRLYNARKQFMQQTHPFVATSRMMQNKGNSSPSDFLPRISKLSRCCCCVEFLRQISINCPTESITADYWISLTVIWINLENRNPFNLLKQTINHKASHAEL